MGNTTTDTEMANAPVSPITDDTPPSTTSNPIPPPNTDLPTSSSQPQTRSSPTLPAQPQPESHAAVQSQPQTQTQALAYREKLDAGEDHWRWKLPLRIALLVLAVIGTGCLGWAVQTAQTGYYYYVYNDSIYLWWALITFGISIIWTLICILVLLLRRPPRPVHPGVAVGMDLILWMAYIPTTMFAAIACVAVLSYGADGTIGDYSSQGYYYKADNGTFVYNATEYMTYRQQGRDCDSNTTRSSTSYHYSNYGYGLEDFANCAEQDAWVNAMYRDAKHRAGVEILGTVCQGLCFILHFMLFVWACVDTHRRNKNKTSVDAEKLAADIISKMVRDGAIVRSPNAGYQQLPNQGPVYPQQQWYQGQGQQQPQYTVHQGPPPPPMIMRQGQQMQQVHPAMRNPNPAMRPGGTPPLPQIVEHYANEKGGGLGGPGPSAAPQQRQPIVEHYGNEKAGGSHAI